jgi:hypothetical protein
VQTTALAIFLAKSGSGKNKIRTPISDEFGYGLNRTVDDIRAKFSFRVLR